MNKYDKIFERTTKSNRIHECVLLMENTKGDVSYKNEYGGKNIDSPFLIASVTKLFTTSCILTLLEQGKLSLDDPVSKYFDSSTLNKLHLYKEEDYSSQLKVSSLLFQTSGLPDITEESKNNLRQRIIQGDLSIDFSEILNRTKELSAHFVPDSKNRAYYADINFDLLGEIIETVTNTSLEETFETMIFEPLGLVNTYLPSNDQDFIPTIYNKKTAISRPNYVKSCRASGGAISTARELMRFIKAFFGGDLFNKAIFNQLEKYHKLQASMYPIQYGGGYMRIPLSGFPTLFMGKGELVGHSGSTGSFAFYEPHKDLFLVGDVNQMANPALPVRLAMRLAMSVK